MRSEFWQQIDGFLTQHICVSVKSVPPNRASRSTSKPAVGESGAVETCTQPFIVSSTVTGFKMGIIEDVLSVLDRIPIWKRLQQVPAEVDEMKARIVALEDKLGGKWPADVCRFCGEREVRLKNILGPDTKGMLHETWVCAKCNGHDQRLTKGR